MSEILKNIWTTLSNDNQTKSDFETWKSNFYENSDIQGNVYNYLKQNNYTQSEPDAWVENINKDVEKTQDALKPKKTVSEAIWSSDLTLPFKIKYSATKLLSSLADPEERKEIADVSKAVKNNLKPQLFNSFQQVQAYSLDWLSKAAGEQATDFLLTGDTDKDDPEKIGEATDKWLANKFKEIEATKLTYEDTGEGMVRGFKQGDASDVIGGVFNSISGVAQTALPAMATGGWSLFPQIVAPIYTEYNEAKAKSLYGDTPDALDQLVANDQTETTIPTVIGVAATALEYVGFKGISSYMSKVPGKGGALAKLIMVGNKEGFTELGQFGLETFNTSLGSGKKVQEASADAFDAMLSEQGLEMWLSGFVGGTSVGAAGNVVNAALRKDNASVSFINKKINSIATLSADKYRSTNREIKEQIDNLIKKEEAELREYVTKRREVGQILNEEQKKSLLQAVNKKDNLRTKLKGLKEQLDSGDITNKEYGYAFRSINSQDKDLSSQIETTYREAEQQLAIKSSEDISKAIKDAGLKGTVTEMSAEEISNLDMPQSDKAAQEFGFISQGTDGSFEIILNQDKPMLGTAAHELMHAVLYKTIGGNSELQNSIGGALTQFINKEKGGVSEDFVKRMTPYVNDKNFGEETITVMSESILDGSLNYDENLFTKLRDTFRRFYQNVLGKEIEFNTGKDVYNFIKDYNKSIKDGKISPAILKVAKEGAKGKLVKETKPQETTQMSKDASDSVQRIYEEKGATGAFEIIEKFKPIVSKIVEKRREAPNFDRELLMSEIEIGKRGILDLISEYKPESGVPLAAFINKFLPARAIEASQRVLGEEFTQDVTEAKGVATEEVATEVETKPKKSKIVLAKRLGVSKESIDAIKKILPSLDTSNLTFKTLKNQVPEIVGSLFGISPKKIVSKANITKGELLSSQMFINKNADLLMAMLPEGATPGGTATGVPKTLLDAFYTKTNRAKAATTGSKAGLAVQRKNKIDRTQFLETFGIIEGKPVRTDRNTSARVLALADQLGKMITNQTVREELEKQQLPTDKIAEGKSEIMFSRTVEDIVGIRGEFQIDEGKYIDTLLKLHGVESTFDLKTEDGIKDFITALKGTKDTPGLLSLMPKDFWFGKPNKSGNFGTAFTPSYYVIGKSDNKELKQKYKDLYRVFEAEVKKLRDDPDVKFGADIKDANGNVIDFSISSYSTIFKNQKTIQKNIDNGNIERWNNKVALIHSEMWNRFNKAIKKSNGNARIISNYLKMVGNDTNHWHKLGAQFVGYSKKLTPSKSGKLKVEYEHAMPATSAYLYLVDAALSKSSDFNASYDLVIDNYKLIYLDKAMDEKLIAAGLRTKMPQGWSVIGNSWWERYFNQQVAGIEPSSIIGLDGRTFEQIYNINKEGNASIFKTKIKGNKMFSRAVNSARQQKESKGITILDFDDTLATTKSLVKYTTSSGDTGTLNAEQFANTYQDLLDQGYVFDFSDFNKVVKGRLAPLFNKAIKLQGKFGPENMFVLTARPPQAQKAIFDFLKANGLNIPLKNITGLGNSTSEAKALWVADKVGEGFNDFYFADDALQNVQAVKNMLDQFDVKSKVQQAKLQFSKSMDKDFNDILENITGIESEKRFSAIKARKRGASKGKFRLFIPPSHEDFVGLLYNFMGKGKVGDGHREFFEQALVRPLNRGYRELDTAKQSIATDYKSLNKQFKDVKNKFTKKTPDGDFTFEDAIRVYLWNKHGYTIPGISPTDQAKLSDLVAQDPQLQSYAEALNLISKVDDYVAPQEGWEGGNIRIDLIDATGRVGRAQYFTEFQENADVIFSEENLNKIEAAYGSSVRSALEDMLHRIKTGINRPKGQSATVNKFMNYLNGSVGSVMFFNTRSALLQQMSNVNYLNFADNNILSAAKAFANQPQYWKDFAFIFNSDMLKQRRGGIQTDINGAELAQTVARSKNPIGSVIGKLLQIGFLPTQIGDNIAIATGGATFYRNRINKYIKDGLSKKEAESKAFTDFQDITQKTQQSARPDMTSQQQASWIGKLILNFLNTPSQYNRIIKKAASDIKNRRITKPNTSLLQSNLSNISRIAYYGAAQNLIFYSLQTALFAVMFGDDDEDEQRKAEQILKKKERVINGAIDTILRGSGFYGVAVSTLKNMAIKFQEQREKGFNADESAVLMEALNFSPVVGIKARKIVNAEKTLNYNKKVIEEMETFDIDNPVWSAVTNLIEATTNLTLNRLLTKTINLRDASNAEFTTFQRILMFSGYTKWSLGLEDEKIKDVKEKIKSKKKKSSKKKKKKYLNIPLQKWKN